MIGSDARTVAAPHRKIPMKVRADLNIQNRTITFSANIQIARNPIAITFPTKKKDWERLKAESTSGKRLIERLMQMVEIEKVAIDQYEIEVIFKDSLSRKQEQALVGAMMEAMGKIMQIKPEHVIVTNGAADEDILPEPQTTTSEESD